MVKSIQDEYMSLDKWGMTFGLTSTMTKETKGGVDREEMGMRWRYKRVFFGHVRRRKWYR
jgi:hypothetical protein